MGLLLWQRFQSELDDIFKKKMIIMQFKPDNSNQTVVFVFGKAIKSVRVGLQSYFVEMAC